MKNSEIRTLVTIALLAAGLSAGPPSQESRKAPSARWTFDGEAAVRSTTDVASGIKDPIEGHFMFVPGISGTGLQFDG